EALPVADHLEEPVGALDVAPPQSEPDLCLGEISLVHALHHPAADPAELVDVYAGAVDLRVEPGDRLLLGEADRPPGSRPALVLRLVDALPRVRAVPDHLDVAVAHAAGIALVPAMIEALPELHRLPLAHIHVAGEVGRVVLDREHAQL